MFDFCTEMCYTIIKRKYSLDITRKGISLGRYMRSFDKNLLRVFTALSELYCLRATQLKVRLTAQHQICLHIFRHSTQNSLEIRQYSCGCFMHSDEKSDCASLALPLCGIAIRNFFKIFPKI